MSVDGTEVSQYMLVGFDGTIVKSNFTYTPANVAPSDDMKVLSDGSLAWTNLDTYNRVIVYNSITPPSLTNTLTESATFLTSTS